MWHKTDKAMKKEEVEPYVRKSLRESFDFVMQQNADLCDTDPVRYKKLVCKGIDWMAEKARHDEALQAMCMVASISLNALIDSEEKAAYARIDVSKQIKN